MADKNQPDLLQKIQHYLSESITLNENNGKLFTSHISLKLRKALADHQLRLININNKLNFYATFKKDSKETMINNPHHRTAINIFRLGNSKLRIETGRHTIPKTRVNWRTVLCAIEMKLKINHMFFSHANYIIAYA